MNLVLSWQNHIIRFVLGGCLKMSFSILRDLSIQNVPASNKYSDVNSNILKICHNQWTYMCFLSSRAHERYVQWAYVTNEELSSSNHLAWRLTRWHEPNLWFNIYCHRVFYQWAINCWEKAEVVHPLIKSVRWQIMHHFPDHNPNPMNTCFPFKLFHKNEPAPESLNFRFVFFHTLIGTRRVVLIVVNFV